MHHVFKHAAAYLIVRNQHHKLQAMDAETTFERYIRYLADVNEGGMRALQANPNDSGTECQEKVDAVNLGLIALSKGDNYKTAPEINTSELIEKFQVMTFSFMDELEKCGGNEFNITMDNTT